MSVQPHSPPVFIDAAALRSVLPLSSAIAHLHSALPPLAAAVAAPPRLSLAVPSAPSAALLVMPALSSVPSLPYLGVKLVTLFPLNTSLHAMPGVHAAYSLFSAATGAPLAALDGSVLTLLRTAAVSALAASFLARGDARVLVMVGAGALAPYLVAAHRIVRPSIDRIIVWNRNADKARILASELRENEGLEGKGGILGSDSGGGEGLDCKGVTFEHAECLDDVVGLGDVVSCATSSKTPLVKGEKLKPGAHLDLVGSYSPSMRECDDETLVKGRVFVDFEVAMDEAGELVGAFERGVMTRDDIAGTLVELASGMKEGRKSGDEVTVFKSVGNALVDLLAAQLAYETFLRGKDSASFRVTNVLSYWNVT